jgi:hypothetical protein
MADTKQFATVGDVQSLQSDPYVGLRNYSTAEEYHDAAVNKQENAASKNIDAGREPYLISLEAVEFGMHPYVEVHDIAIKKNDDGQIGLDTLNKTHYVGRHTLLAWRG